MHRYILCNSLHMMEMSAKVFARWKSSPASKHLPWHRSTAKCSLCRFETTNHPLNGMCLWKQTLVHIKSHTLSVGQNFWFDTYCDINWSRQLDHASNCSRQLEHTSKLGIFHKLQATMKQTYLIWMANMSLRRCVVDKQMESSTISQRLFKNCITLPDTIS